VVLILYTVQRVSMLEKIRRRELHMPVAMLRSASPCPTPSLMSVPSARLSHQTRELDVENAAGNPIEYHQDPPPYQRNGNDGRER
jgi:hypothetical protein